MTPQLPRFFFATILLVAVAAVLMVASPRPALAYDYIVNGSFESGADGWTLLSPGSTLDTVADSVPPIAASGRARVLLDQPSFRLGQSLSDVPPGDYRLSLWLRQSSAFVGGTYVEVAPVPSMCGANCRQDLQNIGGEWQRVQLDVTLVSGGFITIRIGGQGSTGDILYIDEVRFEGAPPATMTSTFTATAISSTSTPIPPSPTKTPHETATTTPIATPVPDGMPPPFETLANGGFEETAGGMPVSWAKYGGSLSVATSPVHGGAASARLESTTDSTKWLFETVAIRGGAAYAFEAWLLHDDANIASAFLRVSWYPTEDGSGEAIGTADSTGRLDAPGPDWRHLTTGGITAPIEARSAKVRIMLQPLSAARAALFVDDASFGPADPAVAAPAAAVVAPDEPAGPGTIERVAGTTRGPAAESRTVFLADSLTPVLINEVVYDAVGSGDDADGEWVELYNSGDEPVSLEGWKLADGVRAIELPTLMLSPRSYVVIAASDSLFQMYPGIHMSAAVAGRIGNGLRNAGDVLVLLDPSGRFVDAISWGDNTTAMSPSIAGAPAGHSIERVSSVTDTDSAADFVDNNAPSPGRAYLSSGGPVAARERSSGRVEILSGESNLIDQSVAWLVAAVAVGALAAVASWRVIPTITQRLRHQ